MNQKAARLAAVVLSLLLPAAAPLAAERLAIYNQGIAAVESTQTVVLRAGVTELSFPVPSGLIPESVVLDVDGTILSQSFRYVAPTGLLEASIGQPVEVVSQDGHVYRGALLAVDDWITLREATGRIHLVKDPVQITLAETLLPFSPSLAVSVQREAAGTVPLSLVYLASGFAWQASYTGILDSSGKALALTGAVSLSNQSGTDFLGAAVRLVAGDVSLGPTPPPLIRAAPLAAWAAPISEHVAFEYHVYDLAGPIDLRSGTSFLVPYSASLSVAVERDYTYDGTRESGVTVALHFANTAENGLGIPLPAGTVRLFQKDASGTLFLGEDTIGHTPRGEKVALEIGKAFDLVGERVRVSTEQVSPSTYRDAYRITLRNQKAEAVDVSVLEHLPGNSWRILSSSPDYESVDSATVRFTLAVPAGGAEEVTYTVEYSY